MFLCKILCCRMGVLKDNQGCSSVCSTSFSKLRVTIQSSKCPTQRVQKKFSVGVAVGVRMQYVSSKIDEAHIDFFFRSKHCGSRHAGYQHQSSH